MRLRTRRATGLHCPSQVAPAPMSYTRLQHHRDILGTIAASCAGQAILVLSGIGATRILGVEDRGHLALFNLLPTLLVLLGTCGLPIALTYFIARNPADARHVVVPILRLSVLLVSALTAADAGALALLDRAQPARVLIPAAISLPLVASNVAQVMGQAVLQGLQRYRAFNFWRVMPALLYAIAVGALYFTPAGNLLTLTIAFTATTSVIAACTLAVAVHSLPPLGPHTGERIRLRDVVRFGLSAVLGAVYPTEAFQLDQAAVGLFLPSVSLGLYVVAVSFTNLPRFIAQSFGTIAYPRAAAARTPPEARRVVLRFTAGGAVTSLVVCGALELSVGFLAPFLYGHAFAAAVPVTRILLISSFVVATRRLLADGLRGAGYPGIGSLGESVAMLLLLPLLAVLIPADGLNGAAIAVTASSATGFAVILLRSLPALHRMRRARIPIGSLRIELPGKLEDEPVE